ncbi:MAG: hypothetical protein Q4F65_00195 [Propionibacteriaceae bacterium]|nr:hypothetical protein [Propionibacteriaceae bacterium]
MDDTSPNPQQARDLLDQADRLGAASRAGAGWPQISLLLGLGGLSSMLAVSLYLVVLIEPSLVWVPMAVFGVWLAILTATALTFTRATKVGFGGRWRTAMMAWTFAWLFTVLGTTVWWRGELWFALVAAGLLTVVTTLGAWREARR